jgi:hypothetical protein
MSRHIIIGRFDPFTEKHKSVIDKYLEKGKVCVMIKHIEDDEMYNIYRHKGVKIMFHSFYNAHHDGKTILDEVIPAEIRVRASDNTMWVIANNSTGFYSSWPTCIARPDGSLETLERGIPGILYRDFPDNEKSDKFNSWLHNFKMMKLPEGEVYQIFGKPSNHPRVLNTKSL